MSPLPCRIAKSFASFSVARLLGLSTYYVQKVWSLVRQSCSDGQWRPSDVAPATDSMSTARSKPTNTRAQRIDAFVVLTRAALGTVADNCPTSAYQASCCRLLQARVDIGRQYASLQYCRDAVFLAVRHVQADDAAEMLSPFSGALGITFCVAVAFDSIPIGGTSAYGRHGQALVVCIVGVSPHTRRLQHNVALDMLFLVLATQGP